MDSSLFHFKLAPLEQIQPWTDGDGTNPFLSWFGLTDGNYWITANGNELFRYTPEFISTWNCQNPYVDYQVARFYEDLMEMLPAILEPVPKDLANYVASTETEIRWLKLCQQWDENNHNDCNIYEESFAWWRDRTMVSMHLSSSPVINLWRIGDDIWLRWDSRITKTDKTRIWASDRVECSFSAVRFMADVTNFHNQFMNAMSERVKTVVLDWKRPEIKN